MSELQRCPYCFSIIDDETKVWEDDPILTVAGTKRWFDKNSGEFIESETNDFYKGFTVIKNRNIKELQDSLDAYAPEDGWTPVQDDAEGLWVPNKQHIRELREAIEEALGITEDTSETDRATILEQYFNYDENGIERKTPHQTEWHDPNLTDEIWQGSISHMHIEDLRHYCPWVERFTSSVNQTDSDSASGSVNQASQTFSSGASFTPNIIDTTSRGGIAIFSSTCPINVAATSLGGTGTGTATTTSEVTCDHNYVATIAGSGSSTASYGGGPLASTSIVTTTNLNLKFYPPPTQLTTNLQIGYSIISTASLTIASSGDWTSTTSSKSMSILVVFSNGNSVTFTLGSNGVYSGTSTSNIATAYITQYGSLATTTINYVQFILGLSGETYGLGLNPGSTATSSLSMTGSLTVDNIYLRVIEPEE